MRVSVCLILVCQPLADGNRLVEPPRTVMNESEDIADFLRLRIELVGTIGLSKGLLLHAAN
jgi:hypothetical protein